MDHVLRRKHRCPQGLGESELTGPIQHDHSLPNLHPMHYHDHEEKMLQILQPRETRHVHKEHQQETFHSLGRVDGGQPLHHRAQHRSFHHHIAGTGSCMQHSMGSNSRDGHRGSCQLEVVGGDQAAVEVVRLG